MKKILLINLMLISGLCSQAQLNNLYFEQRSQIIEADSNTLHFGFNVLGYNKNNEYFNDIADGFTLFGYQLNPYVTYQTLKNVEFDLGVYVQKDFGENDFAQIAPVFSFKYKHGPAKFIFGTLEGSLSHRLIEPLYDFEKVMVDRLENGMQLIIDEDRLFIDTWVDWRNMIYKGDDEQEEVLGGFNMNYTFHDKCLEWYLPLQGLVFHRGGQIDDNPNPLQTYTNVAVGIGARKFISEDGMIRSVGMENHLLYYQDFSGELLQTFKDGSGWYLNLNITTHFNLDVMASYWRGHEFISIYGGQLYPSVSSTFKKPAAVEETRELLILRFLYNMKLADNLHMSSRFEPFYDLKNGKFEFSHGFYLNYRPKFLLKKKVKSK